MYHSQAAPHCQNFSRIICPTLLLASNLTYFQSTGLFPLSSAGLAFPTCNPQLFFMVNSKGKDRETWSFMVSLIHNRQSNQTHLYSSGPELGTLISTRQIVRSQTFRATQTLLHSHLSDRSGTTDRLSGSALAWSPWTGIQPSRLVSQN